MIVGVVLYAGITAITSFANLGEAIGGDIRPAIAVPIFFGFVFGPIVGFVVGALGNFCYDLYAGWIQIPPPMITDSMLVNITIGLLLNWEIGNGLIGFIPGLRAVAHPHYRTWREQFVALGYLSVAIVSGVGFAALLDVYLYPGADMTMFTTQFLPIVRVNLLNAALLVPILLFNYERLALANRDWFRSVLLRRFALTILLSAALPTALLSMFLINQASEAAIHSTSLMIQLSLTIGITVIFTLVNAVILAQGILRPLLNLTEAAKAIQGNHFTSQQAAALRDGLDERTELSDLSEVFSEMAEEVIAREESLRKQVNELKIIIDESQRHEQVIEITESEYFRNLQQRADKIRQRHQRNLSLPPTEILNAA